VNRKPRIASKWVIGGNKSGKSRGKSVDGLLAVAANKQIGGVSLEMRTLTQLRAGQCRATERARLMSSNDQLTAARPEFVRLNASKCLHLVNFPVIAVGRCLCCYHFGEYLARRSPMKAASV